MDTIFINSEKSKTFYPHSLLLNLNHKVNLRQAEKSLSLSNLNVY